MKIGLYDVDSHNFPNLALMKISAYHKSIGDDVEMFFPMAEYSKVYVSKVFGDEYSSMDMTCIQSKEIIYGGTGFAIHIENGKEVYEKGKDVELQSEIEHIYPDYSLYPNLTKDTAFGFLTRGCCNNCSFCIVSQKEGCISRKVADLDEFFKGQKHIKLLDPNILACKEIKELLNQLIKSKAKVDFTQGLDARFITEDIAKLLVEIPFDSVKFAFDFIKNEKAIVKGLETFAKYSKQLISDRERSVYVLTNFDTTHAEDLRRIKIVRELGYSPFVMIYRKQTAPKITRYLQRWCNNRILFHSCDFKDYKPIRNQTISEIFKTEMK